MKISDRQLVNALIRQDLLAFTVRVFQTVNPSTPYKPNWHIDAILHHLKECEAGRINRLLVTQPPRSLKSLCISVAYAAWALGHDPSKKIICVSYSNELAADLARQFRMVVESDWYKRIFPQTRAAKDTSLEFITTKGGGRIATSIGGSLTGRGGDIIIIDDPLKAEDGLSEVVRKRVIEWYSGTLVSRLDDKTKGIIIVVMQRLHEGDLAGHLIDNGGWTRLNLPAIAVERQEIPIGPGETHIRKPDDVLHADHEPRRVLDQIKAEIGNFKFSSQYMQAPVPYSGNLIKWEWFGVYAYPPAHNADGRVIQSWDTALKITGDTDYSVCTTWLKKGNDYYLLDVHRERLDFPSLKRRVTELKHRFAAHSVLIEDKGSGTSLIQDCRADRYDVRPIPITPEGDKVTRMSTVTPLIEAGQVFLPEEAPWLEDFQAELLAFPYGRYDDQMDSMSQFLQWARLRGVFVTRYSRTIGMY